MLQKFEMRQFYAYYGNIGCNVRDRERDTSIFFSKHKHIKGNYDRPIIFTHKKRKKEKNLF